MTHLAELCRGDLSDAGVVEAFECAGHLRDSKLRVDATRLLQLYRFHGYAEALHRRPCVG